MCKKKRFGVDYFCPRCHENHFFVVDFCRRPNDDKRYPDTMVEVPCRCENCGRTIFWRITRKEWDEMRAKHEASKR